MEQEKSNKDLDSIKCLESGGRVSIVQIQMKRTDRSLRGIGPLNRPEAVTDMVKPIFNMADREGYLLQL